MEKPIVFYQTFGEFPLFCPMYLPQEMKQMGVFRGEKGFYKVHPTHKLIESLVDEEWTPFLWLDWYEDYYAGSRHPDDKFWVINWMKYTLYLYSNIILAHPQDDIPDYWKQTLLEVGCNYKNPLMHTKWTIQKLSGKL